MTLTIDSAAVDLPPRAGETFQAYFDRIADRLIEDQRCIGQCRIDGQAVVDIRDGDRLLAAASRIEIDSVPLRVALHANISLQCEMLRKIEADCEGLVTDSLLSDPKKVAAAWSGTCDEIKGVLNFVPVLNGLLTDAQVDSLINERFASLTAIMNEVGGVLQKADVVSFSDILEMRLIPWIAGLRAFFEEQLAFVGTFSQEKE